MEVSCKKEAKDLLNFSVKLARLMIAYGAEVYRVEDTVYRILGSFKNIQTANVLVTYNFVIVTFIYSDSNFTAMRRVVIGDKNLEKISLMNDLSRKIVSKQCENIQEAFDKLEEIRYKAPYSNLLVVLALVISAPFFAVMFGGTFKDTIYSFVIMAVEAYFLIYATKFKMMFFLSNFIGAFLATVLTNIAAMYFPIENPASIIIVALMPLVPGVQITNSVRDFMAGDYMSGIFGVIGAFFIASAIALGVVFGLRLF
ncbi:threonine/serine ThrE exporter family protein [Gemelliphila palaticanis]|uniref:Threonine/serine exporter family protein n=1 Tax=Gemelliphila palaticanis TaxID=81950 RepID=A0ABX2T1A0_9BACL|nr:threonine/serine exporter family protein [Gemella palaticanis]MBF0715498.1 threonine/serine exporter family protein [Gemella palaticanis]NYS47428.1 threonine/serine exporter family protein [Gemella palaticanis]